jgi:hypothetical protein
MGQSRAQAGSLLAADASQAVRHIHDPGPCLSATISASPSLNCFPQPPPRSPTHPTLTQHPAPHLVAPHLAVHCDGLALHATYAAQQQHGTIQHTQGTLHLRGEGGGQRYRGGGGRQGEGGGHMVHRGTKGGGVAVRVREVGTWCTGVGRRRRQNCSPAGSQGVKHGTGFVTPLPRCHLVCWQA